MVMQRPGLSVENAKQGGIFASPVDGIGYDDITSVPLNPGILPGVKFMMLGNQCSTPQPVSAAGVVQAKPTQVLTAVGSGSGSLYPAGAYQVVYTYVLAGSLTVPTQESAPSPPTDVLLTANQGIDLGNFPTLVGLGFRVYISYAPNIRPYVRGGYVASAATQAAGNALVVTANGDGVSPPQADMGFGLIMMPVVTAANKVTVTVPDWRITLKSVILLSARYGSTVPAATKRCYAIDTGIRTFPAPPASPTFGIDCVNGGSVNSLSTDFCFLYWIIN